MRINHLFKYILLFLFVQGSVLAQVNLTFKESYIGTQGSNSNQSNGIDVFSTMGISNINFSQPYTSFGGTQGNDVSGTIKITLLSGTQISVPAALNFRETTGSTIEVFGFIFDSSVSQSWTYNGTSFSIVGGSIRNTSSSLGLKAFRSNFTFIDGENRSGNAANASSMLAELNNELANTPQPSSIVLSSNSVVEGNNLVYQITLSSAVPTGQFIYYSFSTSGSASQTIDYNQTFVFSNSVVDNGNGSITVPQGVSSFTVTVATVDDADIELTESLTITIGSKSAIGFIADNDGAVDTLSPVMTANQSFTYAENQAANYTVGTVTATDNVAVTGYSIVGGDTNNEFAITSGGVLSHTATGTTGAANDFETTPNSFTLTIQVTDAAGNTATGTITVVVTDLDEDSDGDGVTDAQELLDGTDPNDPCSYDWNSQNAPVTSDWLALDCDGDGLSNQKELQQGTDPNEKDSDGDGVSDGREFYDGTDPNDNCDLVIANQSLVPSAAWYATDCDGDGLTREEEIAQGLDPSDPDADGDGVLDGDELADGTDPNDPCSFEMGSKTKDASAKWNDLDCDGDGLTNKEEMDSGTDPFDQDSDGDGVSDAQEVKDGTDPNNPCSLRRDHVNGPVSLSWFALDCDGDGLTNGQEDAYGTPWNNPDLDGDGVPDGREVADGTNPNNACSLVLAHQVLTPSRDWGARDCDSDGLTNAYEIEQSLTNPFDWDTDKDGVTDGHEVRDNTNPNNPCSLLRESQTVIGNVLTWNQSDCDSDGVLNGQELLADTDKDGTPDFLDADDDGDGIPTSKEMPDPDKDGYVFDAVDADGDLIPDYLEPNAAKIDDEIEVYNAVTANGDGINDVLVIRNIGLYPDNELTITNRWGDQVYQTRNYGSKGNFFQGRHQKNYQELPAGIYFYVLQYRNQTGVNQQKQGYLYLTR